MRLPTVLAACIAALAAMMPAPSASAQKCPTGPNLQEGTVKFFNESKGYGFIVPAKGGPDVFVHHSALGDLRIKENDRVVFEVEDKGKGPVAANIKVCG